MSKKYTPTTDGVRKTYASGSFTSTGPNTYNIDEKNNAKEFDRWLNEEKSKAWREGNDAGFDYGHEDYEENDGYPLDPYKQKKKKKNNHDRQLRKETQ
jgi:hypothetical protein